MMKDIKEYAILVAILVGMAVVVCGAVGGLALWFMSAR